MENKQIQDAKESLEELFISAMQKGVEQQEQRNLTGNFINGFRELNAETNKTILYAKIQGIAAIITILITMGAALLGFHTRVNESFTDLKYLQEKVNKIEFSVGNIEKVINENITNHKLLYQKVETLTDQHDKDMRKGK